MKLIEVVNNYQIFLDMDGVLVDFAKMISSLIGEQYSEDRYESDPKYKKRMWDAIKKYQKEGGEVWYDSDPLPDMSQLLNFVQPHQPEILSATGKGNHGAPDQKQRWVQENIPFSIKVNVVGSAGAKKVFAAPNHILVDDKEKALAPWRAAGGIGILHTSASRTIQELQKLGF